jgi:hypothetical protein
VASDSGNLEPLRQRKWQDVFEAPETWDERYQVFVPGHAMLEKFLNPYKSMTANALLVLVSEDDFSMSRQDLLNRLDIILADRILEKTLLNSSVDLSPLPLMGIPGWWSGSLQNEQFYSDKGVFRPPPDNYQPAPVHSL